MILEIVRTAIVATVLTAIVVSVVTALVLIVLVVSLMPATSSLVATAAHILSAFETAITLRVVCCQPAYASLHVVAVMMASTYIALVLGVTCAVIVAALEVLLLLVAIVVIYHVVKIVLVKATSLRR